MSTCCFFDREVVSSSYCFVNHLANKSSLLTECLFTLTKMATRFDCKACPRSHASLIPLGLCWLDFLLRKQSSGPRFCGSSTDCYTDVASSAPLLCPVLANRAGIERLFCTSTSQVSFRASTMPVSSEKISARPMVQPRGFESGLQSVLSSEAALPDVQALYAGDLEFYFPCKTQDRVMLWTSVSCLVQSITDTLHRYVSLRCLCCVSYSS